ncbi:CotH kinase family protein [Portibacter marinus]|uniref:CotH kinase family protein n=1 Tax=Portibacter marinus TaxID=2898660 RepID=UPI001F3252A0|nr:CotH kinase family protein [Portibacter marinus]
MHRILLFIHILLPALLCAQFTQSELPIVIVETENRTMIVNEPKIPATVKIIYNGEGMINSLNDENFHFESNIGIEIRGESSQSFPRKSYLMETWNELGEDQDKSFLNFPSEEDFILYAPYSDKTLMNNVLAMDVARDMGRYASRTRYVELVLNGQYEGVYVIMEKIKRDKNRVDISRLEANDIEDDPLTGGYIFRIDKGGHDGWSSKYDAYNSSKNIFYQYYYPSAFDIQLEQELYIRSFMDGFEDAIASRDGENELGIHYSEYINLRSFFDNFILNELSKNVDAYRLSSYFHKDRNSKDGRLVASPVWDYNLSFGNADYCRGEDFDGLIYYQCSGNSPFWWHEMLRDDFFANGLRCRYESLRSDLLSYEKIVSKIDSLHDVIRSAQERNFERWPVLGSYVWPNPARYVMAQTYDEVLVSMKEWIRLRLDWLDENMPGKAVGCTFYEDLENSRLDNAAVAANIFVYPNPANEQITILGSNYINEVRLYSSMGVLLDQRTARGAEYIYNLKDDLVAGTYILTVLVGETFVHQKIIVHP